MTDETTEIEQNQATEPATFESEPPPAPPRPVTPEASRRSWSEPRVRFWWLAAAVLLIIALYYAIAPTYIWLREKELIENGEVVYATAYHPEGGMREKVDIPPTQPVELHFVYQGEKRIVKGTLRGRKERLVSGTVMPLRIKPGDPDTWTWRTEPSSLSRELLAAILVAPLGIIVLFVAWWKRQRVIDIWQYDPAQIAVVVDTHHTALAPMSSALRCVQRDSSDKRVVTVHVPHRLGRFEKGELLWLIAPVHNPYKSLPAIAYER